MANYSIDWTKIRERHAAFWKGCLEGPCLFSVTAPLDGAKFKHFPYPDDYEGRIKWWTDPNQVLQRHLDGYKGTYYAGDAFPLINHNLGPAGHAGFFKGAKPRVSDSFWYEPSLEDYNQLEFDPNSLLYRATVDNAKIYADAAKGEYMVSMPDMVGAADALSHLRGPVRFMEDLFDQPDAVQEALKKVQAVWEQTISQVWEAVKENNRLGSCVGWLMTWAPGFHAQLQCDCSVMLSADMFEKFLCYELEAQARYVEYALYHFDGEEQIRHLPHLLDIKEIQVIQWTNVAGQPPATAYIRELKEIQEAGKGLIVDCTAEEIPVLLEELDAGKLYIKTMAKSQAEADYLVGLAGKGYC